MGVNTHVDQGYNPGSYVLPLRFLGVSHIRDSGRNLPGLLMLHQQSSVKVDLLVSDVESTLTNARKLAAEGALLSVEGPNEPNNFLISYQGKQGGGTLSWLPVAQLQRDLYQAVKADPVLRNYPVFHVSEGGAEIDNVGLQFLTIPDRADTLLVGGTRFADYANVHNYVAGVRIGYVDNAAWQAADPTLNSHWDGLYGEYGRTWKRHFNGYSQTELEQLPRVTTETGWDAATPYQERTQGVVLINTYLAQFKRGWRYTFLYELGEGEGGGGHQGLFHANWSPKLAGVYIHNLTAILADAEEPKRLNWLAYRIPKRPSTVHELLLQKAGGAFELVVWGEQVAGSHEVVIELQGDARKVSIYDPTIGKDAIQTLNNVDRVPLAIADHAVIVEIDPI